MKKTNKKGFTLVELLAVIVILGVLLMIAVPAIQNIITKSRKNAFQSAIKLAIENVETMASTEKVTGEITPCYVTISTDNIELERGDLTGVSGRIYVNKQGKGEAFALNSNGYFIVNGTITSSVVQNGGTLTVSAPKDTDTNYHYENDSGTTVKASGLSECSWY